ncbi:MAG TPA: polyphosphate kinase 1 [Gemmatimonadales bacterium]|nr:polyphosphate kinase 1 [Gemmatimonadales bacterium]
MTDRWEVPDGEALRHILTDPLAPDLRFSRRPPRRTYFRDVYFDTPEGELRHRDARCRIRYTPDGGSVLSVSLPGAPPLYFRAGAAEAADALSGGGDSPAGRRLRALIDPSRLAPWIEVEIERACRTLCWQALPVPVCDVIADAVSARRDDLKARTHEVALRPRPWGRRAAQQVARALGARVPLRPAGPDRLQRVIAALAAVEGEALARELRGERDVALVAVEHGRLALRHAGGDLRLPVERGSGEVACRAALRQLVGSGEGQVRLIGVVPASGDRPASEVWVARRLRRSAGTAEASVQWFSPADLLARVGSPVLRDPGTLAALTVAARSPLVPEWSGAAFGDAEGDDGDEGGTTTDALARASRVTLSELRTPTLPEAARDPTRPAPEQFLSAELSWLEFNGRVLALAEDPRTPAAARLRFLAIFSTNLDQFVMTQVGALKQLVALGRTGPSVDGLRPQETLDAIAVRLRPLLARQARAFDTLARDELIPRGFGIARWAELPTADQERLRAWGTDQLLPFLTPKALTRAPGHPFPLVGDRRIAVLVALRDEPGRGGPVHYAHVEVPEALPRFIPLGDGRRFLPVEDLVRATLDLLYADREVAAAHAFRVTRSGDLQLDEASTANFLQAIEEELARRQMRPVVRIEIEAGTPPALQQLLQRELRFEESERESTLSPADVYEATGGGPFDPGGLREMDGSLPLPDYPPFTPREPFAAGRPVAEQLDERDVLVHHPYDAFPGTFERFVAEAAGDPDVAAIKLTLYRPGGPSAIADALRRAAANGKDVSVLVEVKARFDEARNIEWARGLERDGIHVVTGLVSLKTHAKLALVVRRGAGGRVRRYAHIGTGNYNPDTARVYTDLGLFTADPRITVDVHALFNELTGSTRAPRANLRHLLVAPAELLDGLLALIKRETAHARAGRGGRIRAKLNGLADAAVIQALYRASQAGVDVDLVVRGICTLRPGVPGLSERIRVVSILGRFLEHARIYHFGNGGGGADEYYIASADWRPRNLRRRVEVAVPVFDAGARAQLDRILERELADPNAWWLSADGTYDRQTPRETPRRRDA